MQPKKEETPPKKKKTLFIVYIVIIIIILIIILNLKKPIPEETQTPTPTTQTPETPETLGDLQTVACNTADKAGTCNSRLIDVGIVSPEDCCKILGKCC